MMGRSFVLCLLTLVPPTVAAQVSSEIASVLPDATPAENPLTIQAALRHGETIDRVYLLYRTLHQTEYRTVEMNLIGNTASVTIPPEQVLAPFVEYYFVLIHRDGTTTTYPLTESADPLTTPPGLTARLAVQPVDPTTRQIIFLSPEPGALLSADDVLISASMLRADSIVVLKATQVILDGTDVTAHAVLTGDLLILYPENLPGALAPGMHRVTVRVYQRSGALHGSASLDFTVAGEPGERAFSPLNYTASVQLESRRESVAGTGTWYNRALITGSAERDVFRLNTQLFVTSDESSRRQPQNRFFVGVESPWIRAGYGDAYPVFPGLIMGGKRVRGFLGALHLGLFSLDIATGTTARAIEGTVAETFPADSIDAQRMRDPSGLYRIVNGTSGIRYVPGTFGRTLLVIRPAIGSGDDWRFGLTALKGKDDVGSILYGYRPQENVVLGSDLRFMLDGGRIAFSGQGAFSAFNSDITGGSFTDAYLDTADVFEGQRESIRKARDILSRFITFNDNIRPLSLGRLATTAIDLSLSLTYFDQVLSLGYIRRGSDYNSFGQSFIRKDIRGYNVTDRVRLAGNRVFLSLGYERLQDNTSDTKVATTTFSNITLSATLVAVDDLPGITVGYGLLSSTNGLSTDDPDEFRRLNVIDEQTNRYFVQASRSFEWMARHAATLSFSLSDRNDYSLRRLNVGSTVIGVGVTSQFTIPLQTGVDVTVTLNSLPEGSTETPRLNYTTLTLRGRYEFTPRGFALRASFAPTLGAYRRSIIDAGAEYALREEMRLSLDFSALSTAGGPGTDTVWNLRYLYDL